jgi:hypothetical protein
MAYDLTTPIDEADLGHAQRVHDYDLAIIIVTVGC